MRCVSIPGTAIPGTVYLSILDPEPKNIEISKLSPELPQYPIYENVAIEQKLRRFMSDSNEIPVV